MTIKYITDQLDKVFPEYVKDWTGEGWLLRREVLDAKDQGKVMVGIHELGVLVYTHKDGKPVTMEEFDNFDHESELFDDHSEIVWVVEDGKYDLDFLIGQPYIHADTFDELLSDYEKFINWLESDK